MASNEQAAAQETRISLKPINLEKAVVTIVGDTPLLCNRFSERDRDSIRRKKMKQSTVRAKWEPEAEYESKHYRLSDGSFGFPVTGIKAAVIEVAHKDLGIPKIAIMKGFFIHADEGALVRLQTVGSKMQEDVVRVGGRGPGTGAADLRVRPVFEDWKVELRIEFDADVMDLDTVVNLIERAGKTVGIGDWRLIKNGIHGRFGVERSAE